MDANRRVTLIETPPVLWVQDGLFYCNYRITEGSIIAFQPSAWFATRAVSHSVTKEWHRSANNVINCCGGEH